MLTSRDRSSTKSQHVQFIKLNEKNYFSNGIASDLEIDAENWFESAHNKTEDDIKNDLLFKPKTTTSTSNDPRISTKSNEKLDLIQQQQREQMLLHSLSLTPTQNSFHMSYHETTHCLNKDTRKLPFYAEPDTYIGFLWSWNFMLGKRWRSQYTGDETFQDNMLADFKQFCSNKDGRLLKFYNESIEFLN